MIKKRCFFLKGINTDEIDKKYGLCIISNIEKEDIDQENKTNIFDVIEKKEELPISFMDKNNNCVITMLDWINYTKLPNKTDLLCFWCKHSFENSPLGCPVKYINNKIEKSYISYITKDKYCMKENVTKLKLSKILSIKQDLININVIESEYYLTDGIFCSFNCVMAFINDNYNQFFYNESKMLLYTMYKDMIKSKVNKIKAAPHWRMLKCFGGSLSIKEFRDLFNLFEYVECSFQMKTLSKIFKEK